jgi:hypothetical protein
MAAYTRSQVLARTDVAASCFLAAEYVTIKHSSAISNQIGLVGFEPTACRRGDRSISLDRAGGI